MEKREVVEVEEGKEVVEKGVDIKEIGCTNQSVG